MQTPSTVLVLGARGRFGLAATQAFAQAGWTVYAQVRPAAAQSKPLPVLPGIHWLPMALDDHAALARAAPGAQVVVHALNPPYTRTAWRVQAPALLEAAIRVAQQLRACLLFPGNVYNFGSSMPAALAEDTPQQPDTDKGRIRMAMEQRLAQATQDGSLRAVVIRAGNFFGSGNGSWLDMALAPKLRQGRMTYPGAMDVPIAWAYLPDLARCCVEVAQRRAALPAFETLHFGGHCLTGHQWQVLLTDFASAQGWLPTGGPLKVGNLPWRLIRLGGLVMPTWAALVEMRYLWQRPHQLVNHKLVHLLGAEPHTAFPGAVRSALAALPSMQATQ